MNAEHFAKAIYVKAIYVKAIYFVKTIHVAKASLRLGALSLLCFSLPAVSQVPAAPADAGVQHGARDGQRDFDFDIGTWKTQSSRLLHPLTGSKQWIEMNGVTVVRPVSPPPRRDPNKPSRMMAERLGKPTGSIDIRARANQKVPPGDTVR